MCWWNGGSPSDCNDYSKPRHLRLNGQPDPSKLPTLHWIQEKRIKMEQLVFAPQLQRGKPHCREPRQCHLPRVESSSQVEHCAWTWKSISFLRWQIRDISLSGTSAANFSWFKSLTSTGSLDVGMPAMLCKWKSTDHSDCRCIEFTKESSAFLMFLTDSLYQVQTGRVASCIKQQWTHNFSDMQ